MRVLHFASTYLPVPGGTTTRIRNLIADPANEHVLYVPRPTAKQLPESLGSVPETETFGHVRVRRVEFQKWPGLRSLPVIGHGFRARELVCEAADERPDVLHGHNPMACALAALRYRLRYGTPLVYEVHGIMQDSSNLPGWLSVLNAASGRLATRRIIERERRVLHTADRIIAQTASVKRRLVERYGVRDDAIDVIHNGVDVALFDPTRWAARREELRRARGWDDRIVCLYAGYLDQVNGLDFLLDALPQLSAATRQRLQFAILGRGPLEAMVGNAASAAPELLDYVGVVPPDEMPGYYAACDVFVIPRPSTLPAETVLPMKLLEALAMAKVVLVSDVAAMAEVVRDGQNGLTFRKGDQEAFVRQLERLRERAAALPPLGVQAREDVARQYTWATSRDKLHATYAALAPAGVRRRECGAA